MDSTCAFSYPILLHICTICDNNMSDNSCSFFNVTFNDDGVILNETLPIDLLHCSSNLTWSNLHSSYVSHIYNFSESNKIICCVSAPVCIMQGFLSTNFMLAL